MTPNESHKVWTLFHRYWPEGSVMRYFARRPSDGAVYGGSLSSPGDIRMATDWADANGYNSYWQPQPTKKRHGTRCSGADITHISYFMVDIDPLPGPDIPDPGSVAIAVRDYMNNFFDWEPTSFIIESGRGMQVFFPSAPVTLDSIFLLGEPRHEVQLRDAAPIAFGFWLKEMSKALRSLLLESQCTIDLECVDLPRLMRMPFTINQKTGNRSCLLSHYGDFATMGLTAALVTRTPSLLWGPRKAPVMPIGERNHWMEYVPSMTVTGRRFLQEGSPSPGRHKAATAAMLSLIELGASEEQVRGALYFGASLCDPPLPHREVEDMVLRRFAGHKKTYQNLDTLVDSGPDL